jgi:hypothetical protein
MVTSGRSFASSTAATKRVATDTQQKVLRDRGSVKTQRLTVVSHLGGEFDPGSGSTLAACLMHASRAGRLSGGLRGGRVRNTWATCPGVGDSRGKPRVIPHVLGLWWGGARKGSVDSPWEGPAAD